MTQYNKGDVLSPAWARDDGTNRETTGESGDLDKKNRGSEESL